MQWTQDATHDVLHIRSITTRDEWSSKALNLVLPEEGEVAYEISW